MRFFPTLLLAFAPFATASAAADDDIAAKFATALEPALDSGGLPVTLYTVEEPRAFRLWGAVPGAVVDHPCARNIALAIESEGQGRGVIWLGVCAIGTEVPADLIANAPALAAAAAKESDIAPIAAGLGALVRQRRIGEHIGLTEVTVIINRDGRPRVSRTALIQQDGATRMLVLQYEAIRLCATGPAPLCTAPDTTLDTLAQRLVHDID